MRCATTLPAHALRPASARPSPPSQAPALAAGTPWRHPSSPARRVQDYYDQDGPPLGSGAFSVVVPVRAKGSGEKAAAKVISVVGLTERKWEARVRGALQEAAAQCYLRQGAFVRLHDLFVEKEGVCLVMELCPGSTLLERVQSAVDHKARARRAEGGSRERGDSAHPGALLEEDARTVFVRLASALRHLHDTCGLVHRDVKLENVLMGRPGDLASAKLADFGFAVRVPTHNSKPLVESGLKAGVGRPLRSLPSRFAGAGLWGGCGAAVLPDLGLLVRARWSTLRQRSSLRT